jgi:hypothetical protein
MTLVHYTYTNKDFTDCPPVVTTGGLILEKITSLRYFQPTYCSTKSYYVCLNRDQVRVDKYVYDYLLNKLKAKEIKIPYDFNNID